VGGQVNGWSGCAFKRVRISRSELISPWPEPGNGWIAAGFNVKDGGLN